MQAQVKHKCCLGLKRFCGVETMKPN